MSLLDYFRPKTDLTGLFERIGSAIERTLRSSGTRSATNYSAVELAARGIVWTCINERAKAVVGANFLVKRKTSQNESELLGAEHWAARLLSTPNYYYTRSEIYRQISKWLDINGNAFILTPKYTPAFGEEYPNAMWVIRPTNVEILLGTDRLIDGYRIRKSGGGSTIIPPDEMIHLRYLEPGSTGQYDIVGTGTLNAAIDNAAVDAEISAYLKRFFANDTKPPLIAKSDGSMTAEQWTQLKNEWNAKLPNYQLNALLQGGMDVVNVAQSGLTVDYSSINDATSKSVAGVFGMSLGLITGDYTNRATAEVQQARFRMNTIDPILQYIGEELTQHFQQFEYDILIEHEPFQWEDAEEKRKQELHDLSVGRLTINEIRQTAGKQSVEGGDTVFVPNGIVPLAIAIEPPPPSLFSADVPQLRSVNDNSSSDSSNDELPDEQTRSARWMEYEQRASSLTVRLSEKISNVYLELRDELIAGLEQNRMIAEQRDMLSLIDVEQLMRKLAKETVPELEEYIAEIVAKSLEDLAANYDELTPEFEKELAKSLKKSTEKITTSAGTVKSELEVLLADNVNASAEELTDIIKQYFEHYAKSGFAAERIARTTSTYATSSAQHTTFRDLGASFVWLSQRDGDVRETHTRADGQRPVNGLFQVGADFMPHPCAGSIAAENVNCRCVLFGIRR